jgi:integration host factor subunit alpha
MSLNKAYIVSLVADKLDLTQKQSSNIIDHLLEIIKRSLESGEDVMISGFGKFCVIEKQARKGRNPATGNSMVLRSRRIISFKCSSKLRENINSAHSNDNQKPGPFKSASDRRTEPRIDQLQHGKAVVRVSGIPIYVFKLKDVSENGTCFVVKEDSSLLRNIQVGQEIEIQIVLTKDNSESTLFQRSQIMHITRPGEGRFTGHLLIGVRILSRLAT